MTKIIKVDGKSYKLVPVEKRVANLSVVWNRSGKYLTQGCSSQFKDNATISVEYYEDGEVDWSSLKVRIPD